MPDDLIDPQPQPLPESPSTVADLLSFLPLPYDYAKQYGLVFSQELADRLAQVQAENPSKHVAKPVQLTDGRYLLCGDLLTEVPNGLYAPGFSHLDISRFNEIELMDWDEAKALIPQPEEDIVP